MGISLPHPLLHNLLPCSYLQICFYNKTCLFALNLISSNHFYSFRSLLLWAHLFIHLKQRASEYICNLNARNTKTAYIRGDRLTLTEQRILPEFSQPKLHKSSRGLPQSTGSHGYWRDWRVKTDLIFLINLLGDSVDYWAWSNASVSTSQNWGRYPKISCVYMKCLRSVSGTPIHPKVLSPGQKFNIFISENIK